MAVCLAVMRYRRLNPASDPDDSDPLVNTMNQISKLEAWIENNVDNEPEQDLLALKTQLEDFLTKLLDQVYSSTELADLFEFPLEQNLKNCDSSFFGLKNRLSPSKSGSMGDLLGSTSKFSSSVNQNQSASNNSLPIQENYELTLIQYAIDNNIESFVTHKNVQIIIQRLKYKNCPKLANGYYAFFTSLFFPILSIIHKVSPNSFLGKIIMIPSVAYNANMITMIEFLILCSFKFIAYDVWLPRFWLFMNTPVYAVNKKIEDCPNRVWLNADIFHYTQDGKSLDSNLKVDHDLWGFDTTRSKNETMTFNPTSNYGSSITLFDLSIIIYTIAKLFEEFFDFLIIHGKKRYLSNGWNVIDLIGISLLSTHSFLRYKDASLPCSPVSEYQWNDYEIVSSYCLAFAFIFLWMRVLESCNVTKQLGMLQISLTKMVDDVLRFLVIFFIVLAAFSCCCTQIYNNYSPLRLKQVNTGKLCMEKAVEYQNVTRDRFNECGFIHLAKLTIRDSYDGNTFYRKCFNDRKLRMPFMVNTGQSIGSDNVLPELAGLGELEDIFGDQFWDDFCRNPEAIVRQAKSGKRCGDWRKFKCKMETLANDLESQFVSQPFLKECLKFKHYDGEYFDEQIGDMDCQQWYEDLRIPNEDGSGWCRGEVINPKKIVIDLPSLEILQTSVSKKGRFSTNL